MNSKVIYTLNSISSIVNGTPLGNQSNEDIKNLMIDSRKLINPQYTLFFAIVGLRHNGHDYIPGLIKKGFRFFVVSSPVKLPENCTGILVENTLEALQKLTSFHRLKFNYPVVAITGSNGKTIVKEWLYQLLHEDKNVVRSPKSFNSQVGVPLSIWNMKSSNDIALIEAGISKPGEMSRLEKIIYPTDVLITNIHEAHDENFSSRQQKVEEKLKLVKNANRVFYCSDYLDICQKIKKQNTKKISWSKNDKQANLYVTNIDIQNPTTLITAVYKKNKIKIEIPFNDAASIENAVLCWLFLLENGYKNSELRQRFQRLIQVSMRLEVKAGENGNTLINDFYNSDIASLSIALDLLNQQHQHVKKVLILSDILQSGKTDEELYNEVSELVVSKNIDVFIGVGESLQKLKFLFQNIHSFFYSSTDALLQKISAIQLQNCAVLIKGARKFHFEKVSKALSLKTHGTVMQINLSAIQHNLNYFRSLLQPKTKIMVMVKAFSYGSGTHEIAQVMQFNNVDYLGVAYADEGVALRKAGISIPIMVMNPEKEAFQAMIKYQLEPEIYNVKLLIDFIECLKRDITTSTSVFKIHIKLDTGMHRLGFQYEDVDELLAVLNSHSEVKIQSVFSHLVASGNKKHDNFTHHQIKLFERLSKKIENQLNYKFDRHILNSSGIERFTEYQYDMVRLGIGIHGISSIKKNQKKLEIAASLKSTISQIRTVAKDETIGYNRNGKVKKNTKIATVSIGYADGFSRKLGNGKGQILVNGNFAKVIGDVCMDMCMIDVTGINCNVGDEVVVFGSENYTLLDFAKIQDTIPYEVLTSVSQRVKRVYFWE